MNPNLLTRMASTNHLTKVKHIDMKKTIQWTLSLSRTRKGPRDLFEIERVRDRERP